MESLPRAEDSEEGDCHSMKFASSEFVVSLVGPSWTAEYFLLSSIRLDLSSPWFSLSHFENDCSMAHGLAMAHVMSTP